MLKDHRGAGVQRAEDADGDERHPFRRADLLLQSGQAEVNDSPLVTRRVAPVWPDSLSAPDGRPTAPRHVVNVQAFNDPRGRAAQITSSPAYFFPAPSCGNM